MSNIKMQRAIVFVNGECHANDIALADCTSDDLIVCVDGGLRHCLQAQLQPDILIGDMDSCELPETLTGSCLSSIEHIRFSSDKAESDLQLALQLMQKKSVSQVVILGASGGRTDHMLFNWQLFMNPLWAFQLRVIDAQVDAYVVRPNQPFVQTFLSKRTFSLLPSAQGASGVTVEGAQYTLANAQLLSGETVGLSNMSCGGQLRVIVQAGALLLMLVRHE